MERFLKSRYKIGEQISENPFSITYQGNFLGSNKPVIIKIYKRGTLNSNLIGRMKQKVRELSLINHHNVAKLIDGDYGWQGFYYVREYIEGESLRQIIDRGEELGLDKTLALAEEVCQALSIVHQRGVIHGALKPENIFIDKRGIIKLADFVIEGEIKEAMPQKALLIINDSRYVSPEELIGKHATASSDIYALGLILYELLVLKQPLESGLAASIKKMQSRTLLDQQASAALPKYLQDILAIALQSDPLLRFPSAKVLKESLEKRMVIEDKGEHEEYVTIFENTVTQYGGETIDKESESLEDLGRVKLRWSKEKHRNWILAVILGAAFFSGLVYAFLLGR
ncbi:MAG: serine/threonine-protein kinase [bacterium]